MTTNTLTKPKNKTIRETVMEVMNSMAVFGALLTQETDALKKCDFKAVEALQNDKRIIARQYGELITALGQRREEMGKLDLSIRENMIKARTKFTLILNDNLRALELMKQSTQRLVDNILDAARHAVTTDQQTNYSMKGHVQTYKSASTSLRMDQQL